MKNFGLRIALILIALVIVCFIATTAVFNCSIAFADDSVPPQYTKAILADCSDLINNEFATKSNLKISVFGKNEEFYIPESYYILNPESINNSNFYFVEYMGIKFGYQSDAPIIEDVTFGSVDDAYPDVRLTLDGDDQVIIIDGTQLNENHTIKLMGYNEDSTKLYVSATLDGNTVYGFIDATSVNSFNVPYHPLAQQERDRLLAELNKPTPDDGDITPTTSLALRIVLIVGIAVPAIIIAILLFKPTKNARRVVDRRRYQDDIDYDEPRRRDRDDRRDYDDRDRYRDERRDDRYDARYDDRR